MFIKKSKCFEFSIIFLTSILLYGVCINYGYYEDRLSYIERVTVYTDISGFEFISQVVLSNFFFGEIGWEGLLFVASKSFIAPWFVIDIISLTSFLIIVFCIYCRVGLPLLVLCLINPFFQVLVFGQLRSALVCAILCLSFANRNKFLPYVSVLVHYSSYVFMAPVALYQAILSKLNKFLLLSIVIIFISISFYIKEIIIDSFVTRESLVMNYEFSFKIALLSLYPFIRLLRNPPSQELRYFWFLLMGIYLSLLIAPFFEIDLTRLFVTALPPYIIYTFKLCRAKKIDFLYILIITMLPYIVLLLDVI